MMRQIFLFISLLLSVNAFSAPTMKVVSTAINGQLISGKSAKLTFVSSEPVIDNTFTSTDILVYVKDAGKVSDFVMVNSKTYTATFTSNQDEEIAILIPEGSYSSKSGGNAKTQFGLNYRVCYTSEKGGSVYDANRLVFPKFGQVVAGGGAVEHVPCYRKTYYQGRNVYKYEPAPFQPILLSAGQYLTDDPTKAVSHQHSQNSTHNHGESFIGTWDMEMMRYKGGAVGSSSERLRYTNHDTYKYNGDPNPGGHFGLGGDARVAISKVVANGLRHQDNITALGERFSAHLHQFYGNAGINYLMTPLQIQNSGVSAAKGGTLNRTGYWQPALIRMGTGEPVMTGSMKAYYKKASDFDTTTEWFPDGLVMIAGFPPGSNKPLTTHVASWNCKGGGPGSERDDRVYIPRCTYAPSAELIQTIGFPVCWDGVNLDSADHMSHMSLMEPYQTPAGIGSSRCPTSHPIQFPGITQNIHYPLEPGDDTGTWTLSSDNYSLTDRQRGKTSHADWVHGWKRDFALQWLEDCQRKPIDCGGDYVGRTPPIVISSITYSGTTATVTTPQPHGLRTGLLVQIQGANEAEYNGNTNIELNVNSMTCSGAGLVEVTHATHPWGSGWIGLAKYKTPFTISGANEAEFNGDFGSYGHTNGSLFTYLLPSGTCPAASATGSILLSIDNGVPKQKILSVPDAYTFTYALPKTPKNNATGKLTFRVGRELF